MTLAPTSGEHDQPTPMKVIEDDDDICWEPLCAPTVGSITSVAPAASIVLTTHFSTKRILSGEQNSDISSTDSSKAPRSSDLLKEKLLDHPINLFWSHFFMHLVQQMWELDFRTRVGLSLIVIGMVLKIVVLFISLWWYHPKTVILTGITALSFIVLDPLDLSRHLERLERACSSPDALVDFLEKVETAQLRHGCLVLMLIPTLFEGRTISYLALVQKEVRWPLYHFAVFTLITGVVSYRFRILERSPRDCWQKGVYILYGSSVVVTLFQFNIIRLPIFAAPFCLATGTLLVTSWNDDTEWLGRIVRRALRLTLCDVLATVSQNVQEDEMLRILMMRWIVDYWTGPTQTDDSTGFHSETSLGLLGSQDHATTSNPPLSQSRSNTVCRQELEWDELWSMLNVTTDHMQKEVPQSSAEFSSSPSAPSASLLQNESVNKIKVMLAAMDMDEHAKPAVLAYKRAVEAFPPTRQVAVFLSICRRCPAFLAWIWFYSAATHFPWFLTVLLSPFISMEFIRVQEWILGCQAASRVVMAGQEDSKDNGKTCLSLLVGALDPMAILLSGDYFEADRPPTLLVVWNNVVSSVSALEIGLTAARCLQTTTVAAEFAQNILSLAEFGARVSKHGWFYGWTLLLQEWLQPSDKSNFRNGKYTSSALSAVRHGRTVARNLRALADDEERVGNAWKLLIMIFGHVWLGQQLTETEPTGSTVEITEIIDDEDDDGDYPPTDSNPPVEFTNDDSEENNIIVIPGQDVAYENMLSSVEALSSVNSSDQSLKIDDGRRQPSTTNFSTLMELITLCVERGLLDEVEKSECIESLATSRDDQTVHDLEEMMRAKLQALLDKDLESLQNYEASMSGEAESKSFLIQGPESISARYSERLASGGELADSFVSSVLTHSIEFDDISSVPSYENCETPRLVDQLASRMDTQEVQTGASGRNLTQEDDTKQGTDWLKWLGGGLAIVGAVVGGVALVNAGDGAAEPGPTNIDEGHRDNASSVHSSVQVELLDDNDDQGVDEWVSISRS